MVIIFPSSWINIYTEFAEGDIISPDIQEGHGKGQAAVSIGVCLSFSQEHHYSVSHCSEWHTAIHRPPSAWRRHLGIGPLVVKETHSSWPRISVGSQLLWEFLEFIKNKFLLLQSPQGVGDWLTSRTESTVTAVMIRKARWDLDGHWVVRRSHTWVLHFESCI